VLVGDVRGCEATARRYEHGLRRERRVAAGDDVLHYVGDTTLDGERRLMLVHERYIGSVAGARVDETYDFTQRCSTAEEVRDHGAGTGLASIEVVDGERAGIAADRLLIVASAQ
jgi:hypothetical protein